MATSCSNQSQSAVKKRSEPERAKYARIFPKKKPNAIAGKLIFDKYCIGCHGLNGSGNGPKSPELNTKPKNFTDTGYVREGTPEDQYKVLAIGKRVMPGFKNKLPVRQRWDVVFYTRSLSTSPMQIAAGKNIYNKNCLPCHGRLGNGKGSAAVGSGMRPPMFNDPQFMMNKKNSELYTTLSEGRRSMPAFKDRLTEDWRWNALDYVWTFVYTAADK